MRRFRALALLLILFGGASAHAAEGLEENIRLLRESKDFRVRTQAALALGTSGAKQAVVPLCRGLEDENRTVRIASASAMGRLRQGGQACLKKRLTVEAEQSVRTSVERALEQLEDPGASEPTIDAKTRFYIALDKLAGPERLNQPVRAAAVAAAGPGVAFAPAEETVAAATRTLGKFPQAKGFSLAFKVNKPEYKDGQLRIKLSVVIMSYPGKGILGNFSQQATIAGVSEPSPRMEEELLLELTQAAMQKFLSLAPTLEE